MATVDEMFQAIRLEEKTGSRGTPSRPTLRSGSAVPPRLLQETPRDSSSTCSSPSSSAVSMASSMVSEYLPCVGDNFLLLDTRTEDEYEACHVVGALSYPSAMLARTMNPYIPEIYSFVSSCPIPSSVLSLRLCPHPLSRATPLEYYICVWLIQKNREGKIIILYDYEERVASRVGSTLVEQGIDNVYVLSGGLRSFSKYFPTMIKGDPPALSSPSLVSQKHTGKSRQRLSSGSASTSSPGGGCSPPFPVSPQPRLVHLCCACCVYFSLPCSGNVGVTRVTSHPKTNTHSLTHIYKQNTVTHSRIRQSTGTPTRKESLPGVLSHPRS